jgi:PAS domain S-box-containing protein
MTAAPTRVIVADDDDSMRQVLEDLLTRQDSIEFVGLARDGPGAIELAAKTQPDVAIVDVRMPGGGTEAIRGILAAAPGCGVVALSAYEERSTVLEMLLAGASGYVVKGAPAAEIIEGIRRTSRKQVSISVEMISGLVEELVHDIGELGRTQEILRRSEERFRALLDSAPDAVVIADERGRIVLVNSQTERTFGYPRTELGSKPIETLLPARFRDALERHRTEYLRNPTARPMDVGLHLTGLRADGSEFPIDISLSSIETPDGVLMTAFVRDVSERTRADEVRRRSEERFRALLDSAPDGVVIVDEHGTIVLVNNQTERLFGYERAHLLGQPVETLLPERFRTAHTDHRRGYLAEPSTRPMGVGLQLAGRRADGSEFPLDISLATLDTPEGVLVTAFVRDVTERVRAAAELHGLEEIVHVQNERRDLMAHLVRAQEEERARIAADIHDDSIQVMTASAMRLQMLRDELTDPMHLALLTRLDETIQESIKRLRRLLFDLRPRVLDSEGLAAAIRVYLQELLEESPFEVSFEDHLVAEPSPNSRVIAYRIVQEAATNARKHSQANRLDVLVESSDGGIHLLVRDDGRGFPEREKDEPGHLGIAAMRERAELAGGWLQIHSASDSGTILEAWVPDDEGPSVVDPQPSKRDVASARGAVP